VSRRPMGHPATRAALKPGHMILKEIRIEQGMLLMDKYLYLKKNTHMQTRDVVYSQL
jgi:hypothetical protein